MDYPYQNLCKFVIFLEYYIPPFISQISLIDSES